MSLFGGKNAKQAEENEFEDIFKTPKPPARTGLNLHTALTFLIVLLVATAILVIYIKTAVSSVEAVHGPSLAGAVSANFNLLSEGTLQYNDSKSTIEFARVHYSIYNSSNTTAVMNLYAAPPVRKIYLLDVQDYCVNCYVSSSLYSSLSSALRQYGLILNQSSLNIKEINQIDSIPKGSIIIIASGLLPEVLVPDSSYTNLCPSYSNSTIVTLLQEGDVVLYVGRNFSRAVTCGGQTVENTPQTMAGLDSINFSNGGPSINLNDSGNVLYMNNATFGFLNGLSYGNAQAVDIGKNGSLIALSNFPTVGWPNYDYLADDISKVLASRFWIPVVASGSLKISGGKHVSSNFTIFTTNTTIVSGLNPNVSQIASDINNSYPLVRIMANNSASFGQYDVPMKVKFTDDGAVGLPANVSLGAQAEITGKIYNTSTVSGYIQIYNKNLTPVKNLTILFGRMEPNTVYDIFYSFVLPSGYYFANLSGGNTRYSSAMFYVSNASINATALDFKNGTFTFSVASGGVAVSGVPYSISLGGVPFNSTGYVEGGTLKYNLPKGTPVSYGPQTFTIKMLQNSYSLSYPYTNPGLKIPSFYIEVAVEIIIVIVITKVLVPPNVDEYYIDVPDIRPVQKQILKENSDALVDVFNKVNAYYRWKDMPLTVDEIKTGISNNIRYGNTKIAITARNAYSSLERLVSKGVVVEAGDYFALKKWTVESNHSVDYLVVYRKLRDFCVANAMLFTELDSSSNMDMIITNKSTQNFIKIYSEDLHLKDIEVKQGARMFIAFLNEEQKQLFLDKLYTSYGKSAELLKMAINYGNIRLIDTDHIEELKL